MQEGYQQIQAAPNTFGGDGVTAAHITVPRKRKNIQVACNQCRARKRACDGERPRCRTCLKRGTECLYVTKDGDETRAGALKRENKLLATAYGDIIERLGLVESTTDDAGATPGILEPRTSGHDPIAIVMAAQKAGLRNSRLLSEHISAMSILPPAQSSLEYELMVRYPIAYPALAPIDAGASEPIPVPLPRNLVHNSAQDQMVPSPSPRAPSPVSHLASSTSQADSDEFDFSMFPQGYERRISKPILNWADSVPAPKLCDERLTQLQIKYWTAVPVTDDFAARIISLYLETDHPVLGLFDADLFIADLIGRRMRFCSPFLVSSLLYWGCQGYTFFDIQASDLAQSFFDEAERLWKAERSTDSVLTVAATQLLNIGCSCHGKGELASELLREGKRMGERLKLFSVPDIPSTTWTFQQMSSDRLRATAHVAWGVFNRLTLYAMSYQVEGAKARPVLPIPGVDYEDEGKFSSITLSPQPLPVYMGQTFTALCKFWAIVHETTMLYYTPRDMPLLEHVPLAVVESKYRQLLEWTNALPVPLARGDQNPSHVVTLHIWYHAAILDLFRPFLQISDHLTLDTFSSPDSSPEAAFSASVNQLKRLVIVYRSTYQSARYTILWHTALLYIANAVLRDATDAEWRFYFQLCIYDYQNLAGSFRIAQSILQGLLYMAVRNGAMSKVEARAINNEVAEKTKHYEALGPIKASFMVDLDLALTHPAEAQVGVMAEQLAELTMFDDLPNLDVL